MQGNVIDISTANPKQIRFFKARVRFVGYGGARGGGKSWALRYKISLMALYFAGIKILLLRRTYKDLDRNHVRELVPMLNGIAHYNKQEKCFHFPNGSIIELGYCASEGDVLQYQGQEYDVICIAFNAEMPYTAVFFHEITHRMKALGVKAYQEFQKLAVNVIAKRKGVKAEDYC